jgi:hypothetical protein
MDTRVYLSSCLSSPPLQPRYNQPASQTSTRNNSVQGRGLMELDVCDMAKDSLMTHSVHSFLILFTSGITEQHLIHIEAKTLCTGFLMCVIFDKTA